MKKIYYLNQLILQYSNNDFLVVMDQSRHTTKISAQCWIEYLLK